MNYFLHKNKNLETILIMSIKKIKIIENKM